GGRDRLTIIVLNGSYQLGPGVFWEAGVFHGKIAGNEWNAGNFLGGTPGAGAATAATGGAPSGRQSNRATGGWAGLAIACGGKTGAGRRWDARGGIADDRAADAHHRQDAGRGVGSYARTRLARLEVRRGCCGPGGSRARYPRNCVRGSVVRAD